MRMIPLGLTLCILGPAFAQDVPPPPRPADNGPGLAETMKFIQDKVNEQGPLNHVMYIRDNIAGSDWNHTRRSETSRARVDSTGCRLDYHLSIVEDGKSIADGDNWFLLRAVTQVAVLPEEQRLKQVDAAAGHPGWSSRSDPPVFAVDLKVSGVAGNLFFYFFDESLANRVAKAMVHAVELCGGGNKEPF